MLGKNAGNGSVLQTDQRFPGDDEQTKYAHKVRLIGTPESSPCEHGVQVVVFGSVKLTAAYTRV